MYAGKSRDMHQSNSMTGGVNKYNNKYIQ
jgi:hypothetical protein